MYHLVFLSVYKVSGANGLLVKCQHMNLSGISNAKASMSVVVQSKVSDTTGKLYCMTVCVLACKQSITAPQRKTFVYDHVSLACKLYCTPTTSTPCIMCVQYRGGVLYRGGIS